jgi:hypothetical protein
MPILIPTTWSRYTKEQRASIEGMQRQALELRATIDSTQAERDAALLHGEKLQAERDAQASDDITIPTPLLRFSRRTPAGSAAPNALLAAGEHGGAH